MKKIKELFAEFLSDFDPSDGDEINLGTANGWDANTEKLFNALMPYRREALGERRLARCWNRYWVSYHDGKMGITLVWDTDSSD